MSKFSIKVSKETLTKVAEAMKQRGFSAEVVTNKKAALERIISLIPNGSNVMVGSSTTLQQIGFMDYLNDQKKWTNVQAKVWSESDEKKRNKLRREAVTAEYFLASANAVTEEGQLIAVDLTGSRITALPYAAEHVILVVGGQKITKNLDEAMKRIREHVFPLEDKRAQEAYGMGSGFGKWLIMEKEITPGRVTVLLVDEELGF